MVYFTLKVALCADCRPDPVVRTLHWIIFHVGWIVELQAMISAHVQNLSVDGNVLTAILAPSILEGAKEKMYSTWFLLYNELESGSKFVVVEEHFFDDASLRINMSVQRVRKRYVLVYSQEMCSCLHHNWI